MRVFFNESINLHVKGKKTRGLDVEGSNMQSVEFYVCRPLFPIPQPLVFTIICS